MTGGGGRGGQGGSDGQAPRRRRLRGADRGPQPIGSSLDDVVRGLAPPSRPSPSASAWGTVFSRWEEVVGPAVARHARPLRLESGLLVVAVDQPAWATQVRTLGPRIVAEITELTGERLERLDVVVRR